jgi:large subunit ribosomal protein L1
MAALCIFMQGDNAVRAKTAGADIVGGDELIPQILQNKLQFDRVIATPDMMSHVSKLARHLGPLGLMPTVKKGTCLNAFWRK